MILATFDDIKKVAGGVSTAKKGFLGLFNKSSDKDGSGGGNTGVEGGGNVGAILLLTESID